MMDEAQERIEHERKEQWRSTVNNLHMENSIFMNKVLLAIPAIATPILITTIYEALCLLEKLFLFASMLSFMISALIMLHSFFISEEAFEELLKEKSDIFLYLIKLVKLRHKISFWLILFACVCLIVAISIPIITSLNLC